MRVVWSPPPQLLGGGQAGRKGPLLGHCHPQCPRASRASCPCLGMGETRVDVAEPPAQGGTAGTAPLQHPLCPLELPRDPFPLPSPSCRQRLAHKGLRKAPGSDTAATSPRAQLLPGRIQPPLGLSHRWVSPGGRGWDRGSPLPGSPRRDRGWGPSWGPALSTRTEQEERPRGSLHAGGGDLSRARCRALVGVLRLSPCGLGDTELGPCHQALRTGAGGCASLSHASIPPVYTRPGQRSPAPVWGGAAGSAHRDAGGAGFGEVLGGCRQGTDPSCTAGAG